MPTAQLYRDWRETHAVRNAVYAHFSARGIPAHRHSELWYRWVKQKGLRKPA